MMEAAALLHLHAFTVCAAKPLPCSTFTRWRLSAAYPANLLLEKEPSYPLGGKEDGLAPQLVWMQWQIEKSPHVPEN